MQFDRNKDGADGADDSTKNYDNSNSKGKLIRILLIGNKETI
jgi:hypothetical protein